MTAADDQDRGAASILVLAVGLVMVLAGVAGASVGIVRVGRHQARTAADLGALAGAMRAVEGSAVACARAAELVHHNGARPGSCRVEGLDVVVVAEVPTFAGTASAIARAGPVRPAGA